MLNWMSKNEIWFEVITDDADAVDEIYADAQETYVVKRLSQKVVSLLTTKPEEGEEADVLGLFVSEDPTAEEDRWLNNVIEAAMKEGFKAYALNDGLVEIDLGGGESATQQEEEEEEEVPAAAKPAPSKRAAKKAAAPSDNGGTKAKKSYTRDELEELDLDGLKEIASDLGITLPPRTRMATYIDHILGENKDDSPSVEVTKPAVTKTVESNGDDDEDAVEIEGVIEAFDIEDIVDQVFARLVQALQA